MHPAPACVAVLDEELAVRTAGPKGPVLPRNRRHDPSLGQRVVRCGHTDTVNAVAVGCPPVMDVWEKGSVISGIGISRIGRKTGIGGLTLTEESARLAIADAGLTPA